MPLSSGLCDILQGHFNFVQDHTCLVYLSIDCSSVFVFSSPFFWQEVHNFLYVFKCAYLLRGVAGAPCPAIKVDTDHEEEEEEKFNKGQTASQIAAAVGRSRRRGQGFSLAVGYMVYHLKGRVEIVVSTLEPG